MTSLTYKKDIDDLLSNYVDGPNIFKIASDWDHPVTIKPDATGKNLPTSWMGLADKVISIIAEKKYGLDTYPNTIEIIEYEHMLDAYASVGMPVTYDHWSFGKSRAQQGKAYDAGQMGLAFEIVINTNPAIAFCMAQNTKTMQMLVIAHASYGHNSFFKGNHMFRQFTRADEIMGDLTRLKETVIACEEKYGISEVERLLDACHALQSHAVSRYSKPPARTPEQEAARRTRIEEARQQSIDVVMDSALNTPTVEFKKASANDNALLPEPEENLLSYISSYAPHLKPWERDIVRQISNVSEYFYPQRQTQVMNEGWASFWHYNIMYDMRDLDLIDDGMMLEFLESHSGVLYQHDFSRMNPYALGFAIYNDIKRMCVNPTDEDRKYFPHVVGQPWLPTLKSAMQNFKDESFILQYLSPKVIRDFHLFSFVDDDREDTILIDAIHDEDGYRKIREALASQYRLGDQEPRIEITSYNYMGDRSLTLEHTMFNRVPLDEKDTKNVLKHIYQLWRHPVILNNVDEDGKITSTLACPPSAATSGMKPKP